MGNFNPNYFDRKSGSLERAVLDAINGVKTQIEEAKVVLDLENDDTNLIKAIKKFRLKVKDLGKSGNAGYNEYEISGSQKDIDHASKILSLQAQKKLDPVGKSDGDIDNDGDKDSSDEYLAKRRAAIGKAMKKEETLENYDIGTPENTNAKLDATPGQSSDEWNQQVELMQKKNTSMREALAKVWGFDEGKNPFEEDNAALQKKLDKLYGKKKGAKKEDKTMTGKPATKVSVDPDMKEKKN